MTKILALFFFCATSALAQFSYGFLGGVPFNDPAYGQPAVGILYGILAGIPSSLPGPTNHSGRYTLGPTIQLGLPRGFRLEADALYRPLGFASATAAQWRFPVLLQYRVPTPLLKPFVEAGYSYDHSSLAPTAGYGVTGVMLAPAFGPIQTVSAYLVPFEPPSSHHSFVLGAGLDFKIPFLRVSPELRYTHDSNQAEILVGLRF